MNDELRDAFTIFVNNSDVLNIPDSIWEEMKTKKKFRMF